MKSFSVYYPALSKTKMMKFYLDQGSSARLVLQAILGKTEGLAGIASPIFEVCDSKSEKSAPMYCFKVTPLHIACLPRSCD